MADTNPTETRYHNSRYGNRHFTPHRATSRALVRGLINWQKQRCHDQRKLDRERGVSGDVRSSRSPKTPAVREG